jgi:hypothetical protein
LINATTVALISERVLSKSRAKRSATPFRHFPEQIRFDSAPGCASARARLQALSA